MFEKSIISILNTLDSMLDNENFSMKTERVILGDKKKLECREMTSSFPLIITLDELESLESRIFKNNYVRKLFNYILLRSFPNTHSRFDYPFTLRKSEWSELPEMFSRYFKRKEVSTYELKYLTHDRVYEGLRKVINFLFLNPSTRHGYVPIWFPEDNDNLEGKVPSLIGFHLEINKRFFNMFVTIRSSDIKFLPYDIWYFGKLALLCQESLSYGIQDIAVYFNLFNLHKYINKE